MNTISRVALLIAALGLALGFAIFSPGHKDDLKTSSIAVSAAPAAAAISIWEIHNLAHLEGLPIQDIVEDQSLVFDTHSAESVKPLRPN